MLKKNHKIISLVVEKFFFCKTQHPFMINNLQTLGILGTCPNIISEFSKKTMNNFNLNEEKLKTIPLKLRARQDWLLFQNLFNIAILEVLARVMKQLKHI